MFNQDIKIEGKHASYIKFLSAKTEKNDSSIKSTAGVFDRNIDVYMIGALVGALYNKKAKKDNSVNDHTNILLGAITNELDNLEFICNLVLLCDNSVERTNDERVNYTFRNEEQEKQKFELFNEYARGGIEFLYEFFTDGAATKDDYYQKVVELLERIQPQSANDGNINLSNLI